MDTNVYKYDDMTIIKKRKRERAKTIPPIEMSLFFNDFNSIEPWNGINSN